MQRYKKFCIYARKNRKIARLSDFSVFGPGFDYLSRCCPLLAPYLPLTCYRDRLADDNLAGFETLCPCALQHLDEGLIAVIERIVVNLAGYDIYQQSRTEIGDIVDMLNAVLVRYYLYIVRVSRRHRLVINQLTVLVVECEIDALTDSSDEQLVRSAKRFDKHIIGGKPITEYTIGAIMKN